LADEKGALLWKAFGMMNQACVLTLTGRTAEAVDKMNAGIAAFRATGARVWLPWSLSFLAKAYGDSGQFEDAWRCIHEALKTVETTKESWCEAEILRMAGEIALLSPEQERSRAETYFDRALAIARGQQAKSWELRAALSMARLRLHQGRHVAARDALAPVYARFTEGFDTPDLKEARALLATAGGAVAATSRVRSSRP
jgi:predicted ATPase